MRIKGYKGAFAALLDSDEDSDEDSDGEEGSSGAVVAPPVALSPANLQWAPPAAIPFGTALSLAQYNGTGSTNGTVTYHPACGTVLPVGTHQLTMHSAQTATHAAGQITRPIDVVKAGRTVRVGKPLIATHDAISVASLAVTVVSDVTQCGLDTAGAVFTPGGKPGVGVHDLRITYAPTTSYNQAVLNTKVRVGGLSETLMSAVGYTRSGNRYHRAGGTYECHSVHFSVFCKSIDSVVDPTWDKAARLDALFPRLGDRGFHITLETGNPPMLNHTHVYRSGPQHRGQGVNWMAAKWKRVHAWMATQLNAELDRIRGLI